MNQQRVQEDSEGSSIPDEESDTLDMGSVRKHRYPARECDGERDESRRASRKRGIGRGGEKEKEEKEKEEREGKEDIGRKCEGRGEKGKGSEREQVEEEDKVAVEGRFPLTPSHLLLLVSPPF
eukprot:763679-Hanusia_phi.AAC.2